MRGDFSRMSFDQLKHFTRVLEQQGRVQLDADWNEQMDIFWHYLRTLARDLIGPFAVAGPDDFKITLMGAAARITNLGIGYGRCYVEGILCENEPPGACEAPADDLTYFTQPYYFRDPDDNDQQLPLPPFLVYLDVWERHITSLEDNSIREVALLGPDTSTRSQVVWQVKVWSLQDPVADCNSLPWGDLMEKWQPANRGCLAAQAKPGETSTDACILPPESRFRGSKTSSTGWRSTIPARR